MSDNLALWNAVQKTDPSKTKDFSKGGGFKGTATNPTWLAMRATEQFGPCGIGWGVKVLSESFDTATNGDTVHSIHGVFWFEWNGKRGEIEQYGATTFSGKNKNGLYSDEDCKKKSMTDLMTKAMSLIGFAADIHMGLYNDVKYVNSLRDEFQAKERASDQDESLKDYMRRCEVAIIEAKNPVQLKSWWAEQEKYRQAIGIKNGTPEYAQLFKAFKDRGLELSSSNVLMAG